MTVNALNLFKNRGYFFQCTNEDALNNLLSKKKNKILHWFLLYRPLTSRWESFANYVPSTIAKNESYSSGFTWWGNHSHWGSFWERRK